MKDIKCTLCGTNSEYFLHEIGTNPYYATTAKLFGCPTCKVGFNYPDGWKEYVSKFPPIMRLQLGDSISYLTRYGERVNNAKVHEINRDNCVIQTSRGTCRPDDVLKWPWELDQKGGNEQ